MSRDLPTPGQSLALIAFQDLLREQGEPPGERLLAQRLDISRNAAKQHLVALGEKCMLERVGEGWHERWNITEDGLAWARMTRKMVNSDPPQAKRKKKKVR